MPAPVVSAVSPNGGPQTGGTRVVITGQNFTGATDVLFGGQSTVLFVVDSDTQITAVAPSETPGAPAGAVAVQVTSSHGTSDPDAPGDLYTYTKVDDPAFPVLPLLATTEIFNSVKNLRFLIGERIPVGEDEFATRFTNDELADTINRHGQNLYLAAGEMWAVKAAIFQEMIDISESGSERRYSQLFRQASQMSELYRKAGLDFIEGLYSRPIAVVANIVDPALGSPFDAHNSSDVISAVDPWMSPTARFWPQLPFFD